MSCYTKNSFSNSTSFSVSTYHGQIFSPSVSQSCQSFLRLIFIFMDKHAVREAALYVPCQQFWVRWKCKNSLVVYSISKQLRNFLSMQYQHKYMIDLQLIIFFKKCQQFMENWENGRKKNQNPKIFLS